MEKKYNIIGGPSLDAMFRSFETRQTNGTKFLVKGDKETKEVETKPCYIGSISYINGEGTVFGLEGLCGDNRFSAEYCAQKQAGIIIFS